MCSRVVVYNLAVVLVEAGTQVSLHCCQSNSICNTLSQGPCSAIRLITAKIGEAYKLA